MTLDLNELRQRIVNGGSYTPEEIREAIKKLRAERVVVAEQTTAKRQATKGASLDEIGADLDDLIAQVKSGKAE